MDWNEETEENREGRREGTGSKGWLACGEEFRRKKIGGKAKKE